MSTEKLIQILASESSKKEAVNFSSRLLLAIVVGASISALIMLFFLGIRKDLIWLSTVPEFWIKVIFAFSMALVGFIAITKLPYPGKSKANYFLNLVALSFFMWTIAIWSAIHADSLMDSIKGGSWEVCSLLIAVLSIPILIPILIALQHMAPVRPRLTGFMAGLFSGGLAACIYSLYCLELSPIFVGIWYFLGMIIPAIIGALLGKKIFRW